MSILSAVFFGVIQGLAEFLPISSSGHLALAQAFFGTGEPDMTFSVLLHLGTLAAVLIVFYKDVFPLIPAFFRLIGKLFHKKFKLTHYDDNERMVLFVIIATLPLLPTALINDYVAYLSTIPKLVGGILIFNGIVLFLSDHISSGMKNLADMKPHSALTVGLTQLCAILPGLSRSGSTITGARLCGFSREFAVKFSFILSIPAIIGANVLEIPDFIENGIQTDLVLPYAIGMVAALITGIIAMKLLTYISKKKNFTVFSVYCVVIGLIAVIFA